MAETADVKVQPEAAAPKVRRRRMDTDDGYASRVALRKQPFRSLTLGQMVTEIHDPDVDGDSTIEDDAWHSQATRIEYALVKILEVLSNQGLV